MHAHVIGMCSGIGHTTTRFFEFRLTVRGRDNDNADFNNDNANFNNDNANFNISTSLFHGRRPA